MANRHQEFLDRGARLFAVSADSVLKNTAVARKLALPFPLLSDPDRSQAVTPLGFADEKDPRQISRPGTVIIGTDGEIAFSVTGRDYADRPDEDHLLEAVQSLGLPPTTQERPPMGEGMPGETAVALEALGPYMRGAKFAVLAVRSRFRETGEEFRDDTKAYIQMLERYMEALPGVGERKA